MTLLYLIASTFVAGLYLALNVVVVHLLFRFVALVCEALRSSGSGDARP